MEVKIRYLGSDVAKCFGSKEKREVINLSVDAKYEELLKLLNERYKKAVEVLYGGKYKDEMFSTFIFLCEGNFIQGMRDKPINPNSEVLVAYADIGG